MPRLSQYPVLIGLTALLVASAITPARGAEILVPAYFYPEAGGEWDRLSKAAAQVPLTVILNPNSGPGARMDPTYVVAIGKVRKAGGQVVAYVSTDYGKRGTDDIHAEMERYVKFYPIDGFFFDEMANQTNRLNHYADLYRYAKSLNASYRVIGNPGTNTIEGYLTRPAADVVVTFEVEGDKYANFPPIPWTSQLPAERFANILHTVKNSEAMARDLAEVARRNVGLVYITDDVMENPYDRLPSYWDEEVAAVRALNKK